MADNNKPMENETLIVADTSAAKSQEGTKSATKSAKTETPAPTKNKAKTGLLWFFVVINLILLICAAGAGYWYIQQQTVDQNVLDVYQGKISQQVSQTETQLSSLENQVQQKLQQQNQQLSAQQTNVSELQDKAEQLTAKLNSALAQLEALDGRRPSDWLIAEADYLVRMAGRKVWLEQDIRTAIMLLGNADKRLSELADPAILPVRALLAQDIQSLQQLNPVSRSTIALALGGMLEQVSALPLNTIKLPDSTEAETSTEVSSSVSDWQQNLLNVWNSLVADFISITYREEAVEPMMTAQQQWLTQQRLSLYLQQAQGAALDANEALYQHSLQQALNLLQQEYVVASNQVSGFSSALENLLNTDVSQALPTELATQKPLAQLLEKRVQRVFGDGASVL
jgi:uroporphyrin-3 C-methyltransferase